MVDEKLKKDVRGLCEGLRHCAHHDMCDDCTYREKCDERHACDRAAEVLEGLMIDYEWRDASVELPADSKQALVVVLAEDDESGIGGIGYSTGFHIADGNWVLERKGKVLYWMPIPKIPMEMIRSAMVKGREEYGK